MDPILLTYVSYCQANNTGAVRKEDATEIFASGTIVRSSTPDEAGSIPSTPKVKQEAREDSATNLAEVWFESPFQCYL